MAEKIPGGTVVGAELETARYIVDGKPVPMVDVAAGKVFLDIPEATSRRFSISLDPAESYQEVVTVIVPNGSVTHTYAPITGQTDLSPNQSRNEFSGQFDSFTVYKLPRSAP